VRIGSGVAPGSGVTRRLPRAAGPAAGFTLIEVLVALAVMVAVTVGVVQLFAVAVVAGRASRDRTLAIALASAKLEQLRSLEWRLEVDASGTAIARSDARSNLSVEPATAAGPGLAESPPGTLDRDMSPYVDYLDRFGRWCGTGATPARGAVYIRRWAVRHHPSSPQRLLAFQVLVTTVQRERSRPFSSPHGWNGTDVLLATMVSRKVR
jgi:prepilin-type N-terminal cleavage/methylation domain-containing protein